MRLASRVIIVLIISILVVLGTGKLLDLEAARVIDQLYPRDSDGVIKGVESVEIKSDHTTALVLLHGFFNTPEIFFGVIKDIKDKVNADIYVPLLPFQGRNLEVGAQFNNKVIVDFVQSYLNDLAQKYKKVTVVGFSYGGLALVDLMRKNRLPHNVNIVLSSPAVFIIDNDMQHNLEADLYGLWRNYCNYAAMGCASPGIGSGDAVARPVIENEKTLRYMIDTALKQMFKLDAENRAYFKKLDRPISLVIAVDDNRVSYPELQEICLANKKYCTLYSFPSGKHLVFLGKNKKAWEKLIIQLTQHT